MLRGNLDQDGGIADIVSITHGCSMKRCTYPGGRPRPDTGHLVRKTSWGKVERMCGGLKSSFHFQVPNHAPEIVAA
jgi:hypothetical protein